MTKKEQVERLKEMRRLYEAEEWTLREIASHFGVTWQAIHDRLVRAGVFLRRKNPRKRQIERETLVRLYTDENLTIGETARRLKTNYKKVSDELKRHGIKKLSSGFRKRKYRELYLLKIGEDVEIKRPLVTQPYRSLYAKAQKIGIRISIKSVNAETMKIKRIQ